MARYHAPNNNGRKVLLVQLGIVVAALQIVLLIIAPRPRAAVVVVAEEEEEPPSTTTAPIVFDADEDNDDSEGELILRAMREAIRLRHSARAEVHKRLPSFSDNSSSNNATTIALDRHTRGPAQVFG